jgi:hypothetical protein
MCAAHKTIPIAAMMAIFAQQGTLAATVHAQEQQYLAQTLHRAPYLEPAIRLTGFAVIISTDARVLTPASAMITTCALQIAAA